MNGEHARVPPEDETLLQALRAAALRHDPVPPALLEASRAALSWRTVDAELAALSYDSTLDAAVSAGVRGGEGPRSLVFETDAVAVEVEVHADGGARRLLGQLAPPQAATVAVRHGGGTVTVEADDAGRFAVEQVPPGPVRLRLELAGGVVIGTQATLL